MPTLAFKLKRCQNKGCDQEYLPRSTLQQACSPKCALELVRAQEEKKRARERRKAEKAARADLRRRKEAVKTIPELTKEAQTEFNRFIRVRDEGKPCISCNAAPAEIEADQAWKSGGAWDCGHYRTRGAAGHLRFNTFNAHRQCKSCNGGAGKWGHTNNKSATISEDYRVNLITRIGIERVERLENDNHLRKFDGDYLRRVKRIFRRRARIYVRNRKNRGLVG